MNRNHFYPINPELMVGRPKIKSDVVSVKTQFNVVGDTNRGIYKIVLAVSGPESIEESMLVVKEETVFFLKFHCHTTSNEISLRLPVSSEETFNLNNGPLALAYLSDNIDRVAVQCIKEYPTTTFGAYLDYHKRTTEIILSYGEPEGKIVPIHTFWIGDLVKEPFTKEPDIESEKKES